MVGGFSSLSGRNENQNVKTLLFLWLPGCQRIIKAENRSLSPNINATLNHERSEA